MAYVYWDNEPGVRYFHTVKNARKLRECASWKLPEGSCKVVGDRTYMHLPDEPIATIKKEEAPTPPSVSNAMYESDLKF